MKVELDDVQGRGMRYSVDLTGQEVTVRLEDGTEVTGHAFKYRED